MVNFRTALWASALAGGLALAPVGASAQAFDPNDEGQSAYVDGNLFFLAYHEVGHMILDQVLDVDQHGDRLASEEAADDIATWLMLPDPDETEQDEEIWAAIEGWSRSAELQQGVSQNPHYPDDATRAARIACYLYGSNPNLYSELAETFPVSIGSVDCEEEVAVLHADLEDWFGEHLIPPASSDGASIRVLYEPASGALTSAQSYLMQSGVLEDAAEDISQFVRLPNEVTLVARSCGRGAAEFRYSPSARRITACYEAVDWLMRDANDEQQDVSQASAESGDEIGSGGARVPRRPRPRG
jgi:hypothetical protein